MNRNGFIPLVFAAALIFPVPLHAQQKTPVVGFLTSGSVNALNKRWVDAFRRGLATAGSVEGRNVRIEFSGADDHYDRLPGLAAEFVRNKVAVIIAAGGPVSALAARRATDSVPIVFTTISDPVKSGLVDGISRPGGNVTGIAGLTSELDPKRLELLHQFKPSAGPIGVLVNPMRPGVAANSRDMQAAAEAIGRQAVFQNAGPDDPLDKAFEKLAERRVESLVVTADPFFNFRRAEVVAHAARLAVPAIYQWREFVQDGGLMSYGPGIDEAYYQSGVYAGRIIKGEKPAELPVVQPSKFDLVVNRKTARTLGIEIQPQFLARVNEVID